MPAFRRRRPPPLGGQGRLRERHRRRGDGRGEGGSTRGPAPGSGSAPSPRRHSRVPRRPLEARAQPRARPRPLLRTPIRAFRRRVPRPREPAAPRGPGARRPAGPLTLFTRHLASGCSPLAAASDSPRLPRAAQLQALLPFPGAPHASSSRSLSSVLRPGCSPDAESFSPASSPLTGTED